VGGRTSYSVLLEVTKASPDPIWLYMQGSHGSTLPVVLSDHGFNSGKFSLSVNAD